MISFTSKESVVAKPVSCWSGSSSKNRRIVRPNRPSQDHSPEIEAAVPHIFEQVLSEQVEVQSGRVHTTVI